MDRIISMEDFREVLDQLEKFSYHNFMLFKWVSLDNIKVKKIKF